MLFNVSKSVLIFRVIIAVCVVFIFLISHQIYLNIEYLKPYMYTSSENLQRVHENVYETASPTTRRTPKKRFFLPEMKYRDFPAFEADRENMLHFSYRTTNAVLAGFKGEKLVHFDFKGAPVKVSYLLDLLPLLKTVDASGLLLEYEDMFPFRDELRNVSAPNALKMKDIEAINKAAAKFKMRIVPLIQTFDCVEFLLKLEEFAELREVSRYPKMICPMHEKTLPLLFNMIDQVLSAHPGVSYLHIGCGLTQDLGKCPLCSKKFEESFYELGEMFLWHVVRIAKYIKNKYPTVRPIIWGDMVEDLDVFYLRGHAATNLVDVMFQKYSRDVLKDFPNYKIQKLFDIFEGVWVATSFKGTTQANQMIPDIRHHVTITMSWMDIISQRRYRGKIKGMALMGPQRFDHFSALCELFPVALPNLVIILQYLKGSLEDDYAFAITDVLECEFQIPITTWESRMVAMTNCHFPGFLLYKYIYQWYTFTEDLSLPFPTPPERSLSLYNVVNNFADPFSVEEYFENWTLDFYRSQLIQMEYNMRKALDEVYDKNVVEEWILTYLMPVKIRIDAYSFTKSLLQVRSWPVRPTVQRMLEFRKSFSEICGRNNSIGCALLFL